MDTGFLILLTAVAGYLLIVKLPHTCCRRPHWAGYHLFFLSFAAGFLLLMLPALMLHELLYRTFSPLPQLSSLERFLRDVASIGGRDYAKLLSAALISFVLAWLIPRSYERLPAKWRKSMDMHIREAAKDRGNLREMELAEAMGLQQQGMRRGARILLDNGMVCTGIVVESGITASKEHADIKLMLMHEGYWDKNAREFVIMESHADKEPADWPVVAIPISRIVSVRKVRLD